MSGLFQLSLQQITDDFGRPVHGALAWFYQSTTLTPLPVYTDYTVGVPGPNPWPADGSGRFPPIYLAEGGSGFYRFRVTSAEGAIIPGLDLQQLPVIGPTGGGGPAPPPVDPNSLNKTGDWTFALSSDPRDGFVRANGLTIGSASSGATERPNADTQALFTFLYQRMSDALCPVSGGRGASAAADFAANKRLALPDARGRTPFGIDTMGNTAAGRLTAATILAPGDPTALGSFGGAETVVLVTTQLPGHSHGVGSLLIGNDTPDHFHSIAAATSVGGGAFPVHQFTGSNGPSYATQGASTRHTHPITGVTASAGSSAAHTNLPPALLGCWYVRL